MCTIARAGWGQRLESRTGSRSPSVVLGLKYWTHHLLPASVCRGTKPKSKHSDSGTPVQDAGIQDNVLTSVSDQVPTLSYPSLFRAETDFLFFLKKKKIPCSHQWKFGRYQITWICLLFELISKNQKWHLTFRDSRYSQFYVDILNCKKR